MKRWEGAGEADRKKSGGTVDSAASSRSLGAGVVLYMYSRARAGVAAKAAEAAAPQSGAAAAGGCGVKGAGEGPGPVRSGNPKSGAHAGPRVIVHTDFGLQVAARLSMGSETWMGRPFARVRVRSGLRVLRWSHARTPAAGRWV